MRIASLPSFYPFSPTCTCFAPIEYTNLFSPPRTFPSLLRHFSAVCPSARRYDNARQLQPHQLLQDPFPQVLPARCISRTSSNVGLCWVGRSSTEQAACKMRVVLLALLLAVTAPAVAGLTSDGIALLELKDGVVVDPAGALDNWNASDATPCHWHGVACSTLAGSLVPRVVSLTVVGKNLSGTLAPSLAALDQLRRLSLHHNNLSGALPASLFTNSTSLRSLLLQNNRLTGPIPPQIALVSTLQNLDLSYNLLYSIIPPSLPGCRQLQHLILSHNFLSGSIPDGLGANLTSLQQLDLSANSLSGPIPNDFGNLTSLQTTLNLSYNALSGSVPASLGNLPYTVSLDLSHNTLSGQIPQQGSLANQGPGPFIGNPALCGFPLSRQCPVLPDNAVPPIPSMPSDGTPPIGPFSAQMPPRSSNSTGSRRASLGTGSIVAIAVGDAVGISLVGAILVYFYWKTSICEDKCCAYKKSLSSASHPCCKGGSEESEGSSTEKAQEQGELVALDKGFSCELDELLRASAYVLGKGGLGIVYKVVLASGLPVAVRRLGEGGAQRYKEFEAEVQAIARVRHPNVVRLRAYYWAEDEKLLIYDYIANGSLTAAFHGHVLSPPRALTWTNRLAIAKGTAAGLAFLHECSPRKYVHGDMKASKVLLDMQLQPQVADFGLARLASIAAGGGGGAATSARPAATSAGGKSATPSSSSSWHSRTLTASSGFYRAPEALADAKPTQKWDVYAFGVILLELVTGRSPAIQVASFGEDLVSWVGRAFKEEKPLAQILDPSLVTEAALAEKDIVETFHIALSCTSSSPDHRPKMKSVFESLSKISPLPPSTP